MNQIDTDDMGYPLSTEWEPPYLHDDEGPEQDESEEDDEDEISTEESKPFTGYSGKRYK